MLDLGWRKSCPGGEAPREERPAHGQALWSLRMLHAAWEQDAASSLSPSSSSPGAAREGEAGQKQSSEAQSCAGGTPGKPTGCRAHGSSRGHGSQRSGAVGRGWGEPPQPLPCCERRCQQTARLGGSVPARSSLRGRAQPCADSLAPLPAWMQPLLPPLTLPDSGAGPPMLGHVLNSLESRRRGGERREKLETSGSVLGSN